MQPEPFQAVCGADRRFSVRDQKSGSNLIKFRWRMACGIRSAVSPDGRRENRCCGRLLEIAEILAVAPADVDPLAGGQERTLIAVGDGFDFPKETQVEDDALVDLAEDGRVKFGKEFLE